MARGKWQVPLIPIFQMGFRFCTSDIKDFLFPKHQTPNPETQCNGRKAREIQD
jgi:hypothetical protein